MSLSSSVFFLVLGRGSSNWLGWLESLHLFHEQELDLLLVLVSHLGVWENVVLKEQFLVPYEDRIEFVFGDDDRVESSQGLSVLVHHTKHIQPVALDLLNGVSVQSERLQLWQKIELPDLLKLPNVVTMQLQ